MGMSTKIIGRVAEILPFEIRGTLAGTVGSTLVAMGFPVPLGAVAEIESPEMPILAEVIGFQDGKTLLAPWTTLVGTGIRPGLPVRLARSARRIGVGPELLGRVVDAHAHPIDSGPVLQPSRWLRPTGERTSDVLDRPRIDTPLSVGVRAIDGLLTIGRGQRVGILAGSGVGKSMLLGMMARGTEADVVVAALIGERSREVADFLERDLATARKRSVCVVATSDEPAIRRVHAFETAMTIAEAFRDDGQNVLLLVDSVTRYALARRELGLAAGEPPTTRGFPPSVFAELPRLLERAGRFTVGSITAICTVLVEADDPQDPIGDALRGILDGHFWLSRSLAGRGHYPAIDLMQSVSRLMPELVSPVHQAAAAKIRSLLAVWQEHADLVTLGAYRRGSDPMIDAAIRAQVPISQYLRQDFTALTDFQTAERELFELVRYLVRSAPRT